MEESIPPKRSIFQSTFGQKIGAGFAVTVLAAVLISIASVFALRSVISASDELSYRHARDLMAAEKLRVSVHERSSLYRAFLFTREQIFLEDAAIVESVFISLIDELKGRSFDKTETALLANIEEAGKQYEESLQGVVTLRKKKADFAKIKRMFSNTVMPEYDNFEKVLNTYVRQKETKLASARETAGAAAKSAVRSIILIACSAILLATLLAFVLTKTLTKIYAELQTAVSLREDLMVMVSHDLKNPLTSILMITGYFLKRSITTISPADNLKAFETMQRAAERMKRMIQDLLDLSKLEAGKLGVELSTTPVVTIVKDVLEMLSPVASSSSITIETQVDPEVTAINCDRDRVVQILSNLVSNAIKFTPKDGHILIEIDKISSDIVFKVQDHGPGISEEHSHHVFDRFWQAKATARHGTGLGLAIVKGLVELHHGRVWLESKVGRGASFYFSIPLHKEKPQLLFAKQM